MYLCNAFWPNYIASDFCLFISKPETQENFLIMDSTWDIFHARSLKAKLCHQESHMRAHYPRSGKFPLVTVIALALQTVDKIQSKILSAYRFVVWS